MNSNRIGVSHSESVNLQSSQTSNTRSRTLCECFRRRKLMWIICLSIVAILMISGICIPTIIILTKKQNTPSPISTTPTSPTKTTTTSTTMPPPPPTTTVLFHNNMKWKQDAWTVAGGHGHGTQLNQLAVPERIYLDDDDSQTLYIVDVGNHRIVKWESGAKHGEVLAGGNELGNGMDQLNNPKHLTIDKKTDSLIICDRGNRRIIRQLLRDPAKREIIFPNISCWGLAMDNNGDLYVANSDKYEVRRWSLPDINGVLVAGGNGQGKELNQLSSPTFIFVDSDHSVYVSDEVNHRVMKWVKGAEDGIIVAGGHGRGNDLTQLDPPTGVFVDRFGNVYVADGRNHRIMRWLKGANKGSVVVGNYSGWEQPDRLNFPCDLSFDRKGNLYVAESGNSRVQKFDIDVD